MTIDRSSKLSILPEAVDALVTNQTVPLYHAEYCLRPPLGIYNTSLQKIWKAFDVVLPELEKLLNAQPFRDAQKFSIEFDERITDSQEQLLLAIKEHFDDCENVMRCFFPLAIGDGDKIRKQPIYTNYFQTIAPFFNHISRIVNHIKHHQGRLRLFVMYNDQYCVPGYFVETINSKGMAIPNREIHQLVRSKLGAKYSYETAFSFFRDLRYLLWGIYFVSHHLANAVDQITNSSVSVQYSDKGKADELVLRLAEKISNLPFYFYEDELLKDVPSVTVISDADEIKLRLAYPDPTKLLIGLSGTYQNVYTWVGDGVTRSVRLLYKWGEDD